ncbi:hypothetical protein BDU57DRAFT_487146 [Ampelomyces quisqualis]|uniref:Protein SQS1 n=1 Tax=Ampelomyces quisqualis TaxID=50730 RepID=A0A6A5QXB2_AMPQU|nr:hypothetical protein BDU57DRAFT_487146 [Ampelomyces quisqualis]
MSRKKGKGKGKARGTPQRSSDQRQSSQAWPPVQEAMPKFSLKDEAHWQSSHRSAAFASGKKLRDMPIQFVSAGHLEGTIKKQPQAAELVDAESLSEDNSPLPSSPSTTQETTDAMAHIALRSPSPALSATSSSSDEVVFQGRGQVPASLTANSASRSAPASIIPTTGPVSMRHDNPQTTSHTTTSNHPEPVVSEQGKRVPVQLDVRVEATSAVAPDDDSNADGVIGDDFAKRRGGKPAWEGITTAWKHRSKPNIGWLPVAARPDMEDFLRGDVNPRDAATDDYMQNMEEFGLTGEMLNASGFARREMDLDAGSHNDWESISGSQREAESPAEIDEAHGHDSWDSDMLRDLEDMSTSSDVMDTVVRILSKRSRKSGLHYLCVYAGSAIDDARWLPSTFLKSGAEQKLIRAFEEEAHMRELETSSTEEEEEEIDDEQLARVLQKQEELGLGSDEMLLYAADEYFGPSPSSYPRSRGNEKPSKGKKRGNRDVSFPSASAMADALAMDPYGGFDVMDTERPSLKPKKKGRRVQLPPELDDSDLNEQLHHAWEVDRARKRLKKAEREELRQQGLLGRKGQGANLKVKYSGGISMEDVVEEIREFMVSDRQSLSLPPMDTHRRAIIHQAAKFFDLSSRSRGGGQDRFTVLSRTCRTRIYTENEFDQAVLRKGFLKRLSGPLQGKRGVGPGRASTLRSGPRNRPQVGYRDGEKVGEHAPELGPGNKGHALLMKMGWTKGQALGTTDNQGILHPIAHTIKTNKAGLQ